ncbi:MAG TPA: acetyl-CoA carboxylase biotin carboxyl carrier protein subunit [Nitrososphaeraceae archaeon]|jgi:biotin carboxyl carrier protein|nr:acetyl-CoA carboxylase biotin carboxyl carrier protein subunit [Nitrososphaeraceae archaeon]
MDQTEGNLLMEFKMAHLDQPINAELVSTLGESEAVVKINQIDYRLKVIRFSTNILEFMIDNSYHYAKILNSSTSVVNLLIDGNEVRINKHSKLSDVLEKSLSRISQVTGVNNLTSQIPGRVVSILGKQGDPVTRGDSVVVLESMKMQVAVKSHKDGRIKEIKVKEGNTVARNDVIAVIE